jgi:hypothetical protein
MEIKDKYELWIAGGFCLLIAAGYFAFLLALYNRIVRAEEYMNGDVDTRCADCPGDSADSGPGAGDQVGGKASQNGRQADNAGGRSEDADSIA